jgi:hypothetical protein
LSLEWQFWSHTCSFGKVVQRSMDHFFLGLGS